MQDHYFCSITFTLIATTNVEISYMQQTFSTRELNVSKAVLFRSFMHSNILILRMFELIGEVSSSNIKNEIKKLSVS